MGRFHDLRFPGETDEYRSVRDDLLERERDLRREIESVAASRRRLPPGGPIAEDYVFDEGSADLSLEAPVVHTKFSELFDPRPREGHSRRLQLHVRVGLRPRRARRARRSWMG